VLLYSGGDVMTMKAIIEKSAAEAQDRGFLPGVMKHLEEMDRYARGAVCRHKALVEYFGQPYPAASCNACDLCLGDSEEVPDAQVVAQKILSCVARVKEGFGIGQVLAILRGKNTENVRKRGHEKLTTFGLLADHSDHDIRDWIYQLIGQEVLVQTDDEYPKLRLNPGSWEVMRGQRNVRLVQLVRRKKGEKPGRTLLEASSWAGVDENLFEALRTLRRTLATERQVPPYVIFSDNTLRELARVRPSTLEKMRLIYGVGEMKLRDFGPAFLEVIAAHCRAGLASDVAAAPPSRPIEPVPGKPTARQQELFVLFRKGMAVEEVMQKVGLARSTVMGYLEGYVRAERPDSIAAWVDRVTYERVREAARQVGLDRLKPIFLALGEKVAYDEIRLVTAHLAVQAEG
jgi:ATP-dependent DNA helicase RecQ